MARPNLSLPHERRKASLKSAQLREKVRVAESKLRLKAIGDELKAMAPKRAANDSTRR